jgi:hypothetical protein
MGNYSKSTILECDVVYMEHSMFTMLEGVQQYPYQASFKINKAASGAFGHKA